MDSVASYPFGARKEAMEESHGTKPSKIIGSWLEQHCAEYASLSRYRKLGWESSKGDSHFQKQRKNADTPKDPEKTGKVFYNMMKGIATGVNKATKVLDLGPSTNLKVLDTCMAPGGFLETVLRRNPGATAHAFTLPTEAGGHQVLITATDRVHVGYVDLTMLAEDMGVHDIPADHPDAANFLPRQLESNLQFDLVICDGQVLRTHTRMGYREGCEASRLTMTQLSIGLEHLKPGGRMLVLLHKVEAWNTAMLLQTFSRFSQVRLMKPLVAHNNRSSFYMIATNVQSDHREALLAAHNWKAMWRIATFGSVDEYRKAASASEEDVEQFLAVFGRELIRLGRKVWEIQARALEKSPWMPSVSGEASRNGLEPVVIASDMGGQSVSIPST